MRKTWRRPRYSDVVATLALFLALVGGAYAVVKAPKNSVTSKSVKNDALKGIDVRDDALTGADLAESSLGEVPTAAAAGRAESAAAADNAARATTAGTADRVAGTSPCRSPVIDMVEGDPRERICASGPFTLTADCSDNLGNTQATVLIQTTESNSFARGPNLIADVLNPAPPTLLVSAGDAPGGNPGTPNPGVFYAGAPSGAHLAGIAGLRANADTGACELFVEALGSRALSRAGRQRQTRRRPAARPRRPRGSPRPRRTGRRA